MVVLGHFVAHGHVGNAEYGHADEEHNRPAEKIPEVIHLAVLCRQLPHRHIGNAGHDRPDKYIGSPLAQRDSVRSEIHPISGSVIASTSFGRKKIKPHRMGLIPRPCTSMTMKMPSAAGTSGWPACQDRKLSFAHGNSAGLHLLRCHLNTHVHCLTCHMTLTAQSSRRTGFQWRDQKGNVGNSTAFSVVINLAIKTVFTGLGRLKTA